MKKLLSLFLVLVMMATMIPAAAAAGFADVDGDAWYADAVDYVVSNKLMSGYSADKFGPNDTLNRAMVVQILYNKEGQPAPSGKHEFNDVASGDWFNNAVTWGTKRGVMSGYGGGRFAPNDNVTLEQIAVILWNYSGNPAFTAKADSVGAHSSWAANGLGWAVESGILANVPYGAVTEGATRAQTAQMLTNFLSGKGQEDAGTSGATGITLDITSHKMGEDWAQYLTATLSPAGVKDTITWSSSNTKVATVDQKGKVSGVAGGEAIITAKTSNGKTATCKIEVWHSHKLTGSKAVGTDGITETYTCACGHSYESWVPAVKVTAIDLGTGSASIDEGKSFTLNATFSPANATFKNVAWSSSNPNIAIVSNGKVTGVAPGTAKIYATSGSVKAYCEVTVRPIKWYSEGMYRVGTDIPAGDYYAVVTNRKYSGYFCKYEDSTRDDIEDNGSFDTYTFFRTYNGQYLKLSSCKITPIENAPVPIVSPDADGYYSGDMLRIGIDIPAGDYYAVTTSSEYSGYYCKYTDISRDDIENNESFSTRAFFRAYNGQYLKLSSCKITPMDKVPFPVAKPNTDGSYGEGMYRVGIDIPAGEYKFVPTSSEYSGYYCVYEDITQDDIDNNDLFSGPTYYTVKNGQYLKISRATATLAKASGGSGGSSSSGSSGSGSGSSSSDNRWSFSEAKSLNEYSAKATSSMTECLKNITAAMKNSGSLASLYLSTAHSKADTAVYYLEKARSLAASKASIDLTDGSTLLDLIDETLTFARNFVKLPLPNLDFSSLADYAGKVTPISGKCLNIQRITVDLMGVFVE